MLRTLEEKIDPPHTALLVVDVQNDFCHPDFELARMGADVSAAQEAVPRIEQLIAAGRSAGVLVVFVQVIHHKADISDVYLEHRARTLPGAAPIVKDGTWGAEFFIVNPEPDDPVVNKYRYSAFIGTGLDTILRARHPDVAARRCDDRGLSSSRQRATATCSTTTRSSHATRPQRTCRMSTMLRSSA